MRIREQQTEKIFLASITMAGAIALALIAIEPIWTLPQSPVDQQVNGVNGQQSPAVIRHKWVAAPQTVSG